MNAVCISGPQELEMASVFAIKISIHIVCLNGHIKKKKNVLTYKKCKFSNSDAIRDLRQEKTYYLSYSDVS